MSGITLRRIATDSAGGTKVGFGAKQKEPGYYAVHCTIPT